MSDTDIPKYLKSRVDGYVFPYTELLAARDDMIPCDSVGQVSVQGQSHLTVKQKLDAGLPTTEEDRLAHPELFVNQKAANVAAASQTPPPVAPPVPEAPKTGSMVSVDVEALDDMNKKQLMEVAKKMKLRIDPKVGVENLRAHLQSKLVNGK